MESDYDSGHLVRPPVTPGLGSLARQGVLGLIPQRGDRSENVHWQTRRTLLCLAPSHRLNAFRAGKGGARLRSGFCFFVDDDQTQSGQGARWLPHGWLGQGGPESGISVFPWVRFPP